MKMILLKSSTFKIFSKGHGVPVPGIVEIQPSTDDEMEKSICDELNDKLKENRKTSLSLLNDFNIRFALNVNTAKVELATTQQTFQVIEAILNDNNVQFQASVSIFGLCVGDETKNLLPETLISNHTKEMTFIQNSNESSCCDEIVYLPGLNASGVIGGRKIFFATVTVSMTSLEVPLDLFSNQATQMKINTAILNDEVTKDIAIITGIGGPVHCHQSFLVANSPVFAAMFQNGMEEAKTREIQMPDKSEQVVRSFLAYLYVRDVFEPNSKLEIAFELLSMGHKYHVPDLESAMTTLLKFKPLEWFDDVNFVTKLYLFARNASDADDLKKKALLVIKAKHLELKGSSTFRDLFKESPSVAMELCQDLAGISNSLDHRFPIYE